MDGYRPLRYWRAWRAMRQHANLCASDVVLSVALTGGADVGTVWTERDYYYWRRHFPMYPRERIGDVLTRRTVRRALAILRVASRFRSDRIACVWTQGRAYIRVRGGV